MHVWWCGGALGMRLWVAMVLAALALRAAGEPVPRAAAEWHPNPWRPNPHVTRSLAAIFLEQHPSLIPTKERRRARAWNKREHRKPKPTHVMLRASRSGRPYDVPQIECPPASDGMERFACPSSDRHGRYRCIDDHVLCDGFIDCPNGEDENRNHCLFYKTTKAHLDVLADALMRWARGR